MSGRDQYENTEGERERKRQTDRVRHTHTGKETWDEKAEME